MEHLQSGSVDTVESLEKKCLVYMKLKQYEKVIQDGKKLLELRYNHHIAFKCVLAALCKMNQLQQVSEVLKVWQTACPNNLQMMESRTKLEGLLEAVSRGIDSSSAFSNVEELLGITSEWQQRLQTATQWKYRPLPHGRSNFVLCLQYRFGHCSLGAKCPDAHGNEEFEEWKNRSVSENALAETTNGAPKNPNYIQNLLGLLGEAGDETRILSEDNISSSIKIKCVEPMNVTISSRKMRNYNWKFVVESKEPLLHVCLLHEVHRQYFRIDTAFFHAGHSRIDLKPSNSTECVQVLDVQLDSEVTSNIKTRHYTYSIDILFTPQLMGNFRQSVVFDFGLQPKVVRNISVEVSPPTDDDSKSLESKDFSRDSRSVSPNEEQVMVGGTRGKSTWNYGNADIVNGSNGSRVSSDKVGFALINGMIKPNVVEDRKEILTIENYKDRMRFFLTEEERARQEIISKYNVSAVLKISDQYSMASGYFEGECKYACDGSLFGRMTLFRDISEDTAVGRLILRSCNCVLLTRTDDANKTTGKPRVYWCEICDKTKNAIYIQLGATCVRELGLKNLDMFLFDIQFQLDRSAFMEQKKVIDRLNDVHLQMLFPDFNDSYNIPWTPFIQWDTTDGSSKVRLNPKQKESLIAVTSDISVTGSSPILLIGPFGTGKTFTLAQCIKKLLMQPATRIMICTQSNSAADLYIKEYLDGWCTAKGLEAARPLRIYYSLRSFKTVHPTVLKYCITENGRFRNPRKEDILSHRVIVVTLATSYLLMDLNLGDCFSHIFLDEAAQAMESEAITPLMSAGESTKLVLAGDHMQLSPELFCEQAKNFHSSLLERLHCLYPESHPCKLMLCENYRSHAAIIQFASDSFYGKKLECGLQQPAHSKYYPLTFFAARGEDVQEADSTSYFNMAEVFEVAEKVSELISSWPSEWGDFRDENAIGVFTPYADQVSKIRARLRKKGLTFVSVERVLNVQGKQFRVVFLSTVRTHKPWLKILPESVGKEVDLGFFSNPKLLNTALTRAQSLVSVVGDPVSLCSVGKCRVLWEDYIRVCHENGSLHGISYAQLKENIVGVELRLTWGLNPLASEFEPKMSHIHPNNTTSSNNFNNTISYSQNASVTPASNSSNSSGVYLRATETSHLNNTAAVQLPIRAPSPSYYAGHSINLANQSQQPATSQQQQQIPQLQNNVTDAQGMSYQIVRPAQHSYRYVPVPIGPQPTAVIRSPYAPAAAQSAYPDYAVTPIAAVGNVYPSMILHPSVNPYLAAQAVALQTTSSSVRTPQVHPAALYNQYPHGNAQVRSAPIAQPISAPFNNSYSASIEQQQQQQQQTPQLQNIVRSQDQVNNYRNYPNLQQHQLQQQQQQPAIQTKPFPTDIARYQQQSSANLNPQTAVGVPLYRRQPDINNPSTNTNYLNPSQEPGRQQQQQQQAVAAHHALAAQVNSGSTEHFSQEEKLYLKRLVEWCRSNSSGDVGGMTLDDMQSLCSKLGSVSDGSGSVPSHINHHGLPGMSSEINMLDHHHHQQLQKQQLQQQQQQQQRIGVTLESAAMALACQTSNSINKSAVNSSNFPHPSWVANNSGSGNISNNSGVSNYNNKSNSFVQRDQQLTYSNGNISNPSHTQLQNSIPPQSYNRPTVQNPSYIPQQQHPLHHSHHPHHVNNESNGDLFGNLSVFQGHSMNERRGPPSTSMANNDAGLSSNSRSYANVVKQAVSVVPMRGGNNNTGSNCAPESDSSSQYVPLFSKNTFSRTSIMNHTQRVTLDKSNISHTPYKS